LRIIIERSQASMTTTVLRPQSPFVSNNKRPRSGSVVANNKRIKSSVIVEKNTDYWDNETAYAIAVVDTNTFINSIDKVNNLKFYNNMQVVVPMIGMFCNS
jgi:hypothetical protein